MEVALSGGFNRAASKLHLAQSAISRRIARLEHDVGAELFVRTKRGVRLTPAGALLLERSQALLRHFRQVQGEMLAEASEPRGELAVGLPPSLNLYSARLLRKLRNRFPLLFVRTWVATSVDLRTMLLSGQLDLAVYATSEEDRLVDAAAARHHAKLSVVMEVNDVYLLTHLVEEKAGFTILPSSALGRSLSSRLSSVELPPAALSWVVAHSSEKPLSVGAERTIGLIRETFAPKATRP